MKLRYRIGSEAVQCEPLEVKIDGDFDYAFRKFKALFQKEKIISELKDRSAYEKPSDKKRRKKREARERQMMLEARERMIASGEWARRQKKKEQNKKRKQEKRKQRQENSGDLL